MIDLKIHDSGLYNLETPIGFFKLKRVPWKYRLNPMRWRWFKPWHRWRVCPGEGMDYLGGFSINSAYKNMVHWYSSHYGINTLEKWGWNNKAYKSSGIRYI